MLQMVVFGAVAALVPCRTYKGQPYEWFETHSWTTFSALLSEQAQKRLIEGLKRLTAHRLVFGINHLRTADVIVDLG